MAPRRVDEGEGPVAPDRGTARRRPLSRSQGNGSEDHPGDGRTGGRPARRRRGLRAALGLVASAATLTPACGSTPDGNGFGVILADVEWSQVAYGDGIQVSVAVVRPDQYSDTGRHPVVLALPWGGGTPDLVLGMLDAYWSLEAPRRGYLVVSPAILGSSLQTQADLFLPSLFAWMDATLSYDPERVVLVGASNGGRGIFHALVSDPSRFSAVIGMPGSYTGPSEALTAFAGNPAWLLVGESDTNWRTAAESTRVILEAAGIETRLDVIPGQGHVLVLSQSGLMDWIDGALGGP